MYNQDLFEGARNIHMGIDIGAPVGTPVKSFYQGHLAYMDYNSAKGDYGYTLVTKHRIGDKDLFALYGHLSAPSLENKKLGQEVSKGEVIAWVGDKHENGGWNSHLHFQLSWKDPQKADMPGAVSDKDREESLLMFPDPQLVLGKLY
jgi:murein DD-endopeptidase MepM/ murein hydrolase activator NlpD